MHVDARAYDDIWKKQFPEVPSRDLEWENKTYELKRSLGLVLEFFGWVPCYWWLKLRRNGKTSFNESNDMVVSWLAELVVRDIPVILSVLASLHNGLTSSVKEKKTALVYLETTWHLPIPLFPAKDLRAGHIAKSMMSKGNTALLSRTLTARWHLLSINFVLVLEVFFRGIKT